ncbi:hypothetical protein K443DRAFT_540452 [Laccaria amethystina LaAM-08-1]|uniref:Uncharacterized protein n=1 Tax=Laccaria amethystina LaAM-08-1 TaxID=1095629 RepID=A0A0C9XKS5_9AGAR|nr:hypothetical protein K443DRAFT_540452 [Laccaria amethystina LaAM-08-1]
MHNDARSIADLYSDPTISTVCQGGLCLLIDDFEGQDLPAACPSWVFRGCRRWLGQFADISIRHFGRPRCPTQTSQAI